MRAELAETKRARELRSNPTDAEERPWDGLRQLRPKWHFRRQHPIGSYIVDFACAAAKLIVEADGGQYNDLKSDSRRDGRLAREGWRALRLWNNDILMNRDGVVETIVAVLSESPLPQPSPASGGGRDPRQREGRGFDRAE